MANKLSKALANSETNPFIDVVKNVEERSRANSEATEPKAEPVKAEEPKKAKKENQATKTTGKVGRPKKAQTVKETAHRIAFNINNDLFEYWKEEAEADHTTMASIINQLLKAEKERRESGRE